MNNLVKFQFQGNQVLRTVLIDGDPWWVAKDVCKILDLSNPSVVIQSLDEDERSKFNLGRQGEASIINEPGLYSLILRSRKPKAKTFKRWITHEVLPTIRKKGGYGLSGSTEARMDRLESMVEKLVIAVSEIPKTINQMVKALSSPNASPLESEYFTVKAYAIRLRQPINLQTAKSLGMEARRLSIQKGVPFHKVADEQWGVVNSYHISILKEIFTA